MNHEMQSKVYSTTNAEDDHKLYELTVRMKQLAINVKGLAQYNSDLTGDADTLADTVLEFLKVSGWSRS